MIKKLFRKLHSARFTHYATIGSSTFVLEIVILFVLKEYFGFSPTLAVAVEQFVTMFYAFLLNKYWAFRHHKSQFHTSVIRFLMLSAWNYLYSVGWMYVWTEVFHISYWAFNHDLGYLIGRVISIMIMITWDFYLYKYWVYKNHLI